MNSETQAKLAALYQEDYQRWLSEMIVELRSRNFDRLDLENLIEEIESLGKSEKRALASYLMRLCEHLLKVQYWETERDACLRGWKVEIRNFRLQIARLLKDSPSLKNDLVESFDQEYLNARQLFLDASDWKAEVVPEKPCFTLEEALNEAWLP